jgi:hypothetical protein
VREADALSAPDAPQQLVDMAVQVYRLASQHIVEVGPWIMSIELG